MTHHSATVCCCELTKVRREATHSPHLLGQTVRYHWQPLASENCRRFRSLRLLGGIRCPAILIVWTPPSSEKLRASKAHFQERPGFSHCETTFTSRTHEKAEAAQILRHGPLHPIRRINPFLDETVACCRFFLANLIVRARCFKLGDMMR